MARMTALIVEDNVGDADLAIERLSDNRHVDFDTTHVATLREATEWLASHACDVVILDLNLPDSTGVDTLRATQGFGRRPTVVLTGTVNEQLRAEALLGGAADVISKDALGTPTFATDILYALERNRALAQQEQLEKILDTRHDAVVVVDRAGHVKYVNGDALRFFDRTREELATERLSFASPEGAPTELRVSRPSGERVGQMHVTEFDWHGERVFLASIRDVTQQKHLELQLLMSDRLVSLGTLAAGVAHEINNPLAAVISNVGLALSELAPLASDSQVLRDAMEGLADARTAADRIRQIVRDLHVFSRPAAEARDAVDVHEILDSVTRMAANEIRYRARLVKEYGSVPTVFANESRLSQVFLNLVVNAAQAIPEGHHEKNEIRLTTRADRDGRVLIEVRDTGVGIDPDVQRRIFTPFFTTKPVGSGTGLGLAICQRIIDGMGGTISFESAVGSGSCFRVTLPAGEPVELQPTEKQPEPRRRGSSVMVIDDEALIIQSVRRILGDRHEVTSFARADAALEVLRSGARFDVILCDLMMPEMTGMTFCEAVERLDAAQAARIVIVTGGVFTPHAREFLDSARYRRLEKPFDHHSLRAIVSSVVS